ncbi:uncharacterized protein AKAME5_000581600 [Lates japonicus]|uniref:DUF4939 domain-containing protein n=1 Tax=Lates japonicus TaxID=270547 RepID=A0AAD3MGB2_LATJO|nr:uncharacterized protein AKAME5_000581600 [Lates japonicus]
MKNPADTDPVHQAVSHHGVLLSQHTLALREVMEGLSDLATKVLEIQDQINQPPSPEDQPPAPTSAAPTLVPIKEPWVPSPDRFDCEFGLCHSFLLQCDLVFTQQPHTCSSEQSRIAYLIGLLRGNALAWATALWEKQSPVTATYAAFTAEMRRVFDHPVRGQDASKRLLSLCQGLVSLAIHIDNQLRERRRDSGAHPLHLWCSLLLLQVSAHSKVREAQPGIP